MDLLLALIAALAVPQAPAKQDTSIPWPPLHFTPPASWSRRVRANMQIMMPRDTAAGESLALTLIRVEDGGAVPLRQMAAPLIDALGTADNGEDTVTRLPESSGKSPGGVLWLETGAIAKRRDGSQECIAVNAYRYGTAGAVVVYEANALPLFERYDAVRLAFNAGIRIDRLGVRVPPIADLVGTWDSHDHWPPIVVNADGTYTSGPIDGHWTAVDGGIAFDGRMMVWNNGRAAVHGSHLAFRWRDEHRRAHLELYEKRVPAPGK